MAKEAPKTSRRGHGVIGLAKPEIIFPPLSPETQSLIERLGSGGYDAIYHIAGRTPEDLKKDDMPYWYLTAPLIEETPLPALLAFKTDPAVFFLPGSHNIPYDKQLELLADKQARVEKEYPDMGLVVREGKLAEWTELAFRHWKAKEVRITGGEYGSSYTWANTYESHRPGASRAVMGAWDAARGLRVHFWGPDTTLPNLGLAYVVEIPLGV